MDCETVRTALSAVLDGEDPGVDQAAIDAHLAVCPACRRWKLAAHDLTRQIRLQALAPEATDPESFVRKLRETFKASSGSDHLRLLKIGLMVAGVTQIAVTLPTLLTGGSDDVLDLLSLQVALGVGFLVCSLRPNRAPALVLMVGTGALLLTMAATIDLVRGDTKLHSEASHAVTLVGWILLCLTAKRVPSTARDERIHWPVHLDQIPRMSHKSVSALLARSGMRRSVPSLQVPDSAVSSTQYVTQSSAASDQLEQRQRAS
jgi:predicted anti-sigma-YlaC factor YlaD